MTYLRAVLLVAAKDLRVELRSREQAVTLLFFALLVLVVFNFAFDFTVIDFVTLGPGVLWVAFIFSGVLAICRSFQIEREQDRIQGILLSPIDRSAFYLGKVAATVLFMAVVEILIVPVAVAMFNFRFSGRILLAILALLLETDGVEKKRQDRQEDPAAETEVEHRHRHGHDQDLHDRHEQHRGRDLAQVEGAAIDRREQDPLDAVLLA